jgi:small-conductance mechanosensitive channel
MLDEIRSYIPVAELKTLLAAAVTVLVLMIASRLLTKVLERLARPVPFLREMVSQLRAPVCLLLPLLGLQTVWTAADDNLMLIGALRHVTTLAIIGTFTWLGLRAVAAVQEMILIHNPVDIADNLRARRIQTQTRVLVRTLGFFVLLFGLATMLMTFPSARQFGGSLLASAGVAGLAVGFAAKPVLGNLIAGLQIAITQPIRLDDVVIVENEWGRIEEITGTYVVVRIWDDRRLIVPLQWFIENPFQNWTRVSSSLTGAITFWVDYAIPLEPLRKELERLLHEVPQLWDGRVSVLQVVETTDRAIQLRVLVSTRDSSSGWDLRCYIRENLINFISHKHPDCLPQLRAAFQTSPTTEVVNPHRHEPIAEPERQPPV